MTSKFDRRTAEDLRLDVAYAVGEGMDPMAYLELLHRARGWR